MCTKHEHCCSTKVNIHQPAGNSCSAPKITAIKAVAVENSDCCSSDSGSGGGSCCSPGPSDEEGDPAGLLNQETWSNQETQFTHSWKVVGMDCPACARKVETVVNCIEGVDQVRVLFATEKLVVKSSQHSIISTIEAAVAKAGFTLHSVSERKDKKTNKKDIRSFMAENLQLFSLAATMGIASVVNMLNPQAGEWLFIFVCLAGLIPIVRRAYQLALSGSPFSIETLMSVAALGALYLGETTEAAMVLLLFLLGEKLEAFASSKARSGVESLMALVPERAIKIINGERVEVSAEELEPDDIIEVSAGSRLPADGILLSAASFDESALTGESLPVERIAGEQVMAGSVVVDRVVQLTITSRQGENAIDRILHLIEEAESHKAPMERFLDRFSRGYTPLMMMLSLLVILIPPLFFAQPWETWIYRGLALLLIACPCALVISTPAAITSGLAAAAKRGALIKGGAALELLGRVETIAFDKTGTLTQGKPEVTDLLPLNSLDSMQILSLAASIETGSSHPLAISLVKKASESGCQIAHATDKRALAGSGVAGDIDGICYTLVSPDKSKEKWRESVAEKISELESQGKTVAVLFKAKEPVGLITWQDTVRTDAGEAVEILDRMGVRSIMLTGDNPKSAANIGASVGIDFKASLLPQDKVDYVNELSRSGHVAMVGDGINDAPAMKAATIGIAMGSGTDVALETADAAITNNRLTGLSDMIALSRATLANIRQNVTIALGLKGVFLITSLFGITGLWVAVLADSGSTVLVTLNALRLLRK